MMIMPCKRNDLSTFCKTISPIGDFRGEKVPLEFPHFEYPDTLSGRPNRSSRITATPFRCCFYDISNSHRPLESIRHRNGSPSCFDLGASQANTSPPLPPIVLPCAAKPALHSLPSPSPRRKHPDGSGEHARNPSAPRHGRIAPCPYP